MTIAPGGTCTWTLQARGLGRLRRWLAAEGDTGGDGDEPLSAEGIERLLDEGYTPSEIEDALRAIQRDRQADADDDVTASVGALRAQEARDGAPSDGEGGWGRATARMPSGTRTASTR